MKPDEPKVGWWYKVTDWADEPLSQFEGIDSDGDTLVKDRHGMGYAEKHPTLVPATLDDLAVEIPDSGGLKVWMVESGDSIYLKCSEAPTQWNGWECSIARHYAKLAGIPIISQEQWEELTK